MSLVYSIMITYIFMQYVDSKLAKVKVLNNVATYSTKEAFSHTRDDCEA